MELFLFSCTLSLDEERDEDWDVTRDRTVSELTDTSDPKTGDGARVPDGVFGS